MKTILYHLFFNGETDPMSDSHMAAAHAPAKKQAALVSLGVSALLLAIKFWAYNLTDSKAILSDAMESIVNVISAGLVLGLISYATQPPDEDHPYGHGKVEYFSAAFEGGMISFAALMIAYESVSALLKGNVLHNLDQGLWLVAAAGLVNLGLGVYLKRVGKKHHSLALESSGAHVIADFWTSFGVIVGLVLVYFTGWNWLDSAAAILVSGQLAINGIKIIRRSVAGLTDEIDDDSLVKLKEIFESNPHPGLIHFHYVRTIRSGAFHHIDAHVVVPEFWTVDVCHDETQSYEKKVEQEYAKKVDFAFHLDPCRRAYCKVCDYQDCPIREQEFVAKEPISLEELKSAEEPRRFSEDK
jgi:cation diffusion facilitator family transporter